MPRLEHLLDDPGSMPMPFPIPEGCYHQLHIAPNSMGRGEGGGGQKHRFIHRPDSKLCELETMQRLVVFMV